MPTAMSATDAAVQMSLTVETTCALIGLAAIATARSIRPTNRASTAVDGRNGGNLVQRRQVLYLDNDGRLFATVGQVISHGLRPVASGPRRSREATTAVSKVRGFDDGLCLRNVCDMRYDNTCRAAIQRIANPRCRVIRQPNENRHIGSTKRGDAVIHLEPAERRVLGVDCDNVER